MRVLITGSSSGIGAAISDYLHKKSWHVTGVDYKPSIGFCDDFYTLDLSSIEEVSKFIEGHTSHYDALIYCAGIREICNPCDLPIEQWIKIMNVNLNSSFIISQALIQVAIANQKQLNIINLASISGIQAEPNRGAYVASKFGLIGLTKQLALQFGGNGIRTNAIAPGIIETPLTKSYFDDPILVTKLKSSIPVGYWGQTEHIIPLVELCLTNTYMNGSILVCDGGWTTGKDL